MVFHSITQDERRRAIRYPYSVKIQFADATGITRDISGLGVLFHADTRMEPGDEADFTILLPDTARVRCRGKVVRVSENSHGYDIAATIERSLLPEESAVSDDVSSTIRRELRQFHPEGWEWGE